MNATLWAGVVVIVLTLAFTFVEVWGPDWTWYRRVRTTLFRLFPYKGARVGWYDGDGVSVWSKDDYVRGDVMAVDRKFKRVLVQTRHRLDPARSQTVLKSEWWPVREIEWFPEEDS